MDKLIFDFQIETYPNQIAELVCETGKVRMIPFGGKVSSALFTGRLLPGAVDVQVTDASGIRHMQAQYMFAGHDTAGMPCKLFVRNNGFFEPGHAPKPFHACPDFMTDSKALSEYLHQRRFRAEGSREADCLHIRVFDVLQDDGPGGETESL